MKTKLDKSPYECCNFKKFVKDEDMKACGTEFGPKAGGPPPMPPPGEQPAGCVSFYTIFSFDIFTQK